ncbi:Phosphatidate phosphatase APP1 [Metschnikowia aff. pulcherrima]|uniref:Phosphatidate phosphatase APP1 n=1 Tax=Metschnikowia aff. pulcherrima TaxID=2163413 RepID=A0A4P6XIM1_9ASCO|nr:Phosphatidate phosphatase APP1 [Metschnikowia aff. pulcherrima]
MIPAPTSTKSIHDLDTLDYSTLTNNGTSNETLKTTASDDSASTLRPPVSPTLQAAGSRRQRLLGFARATRDTYIPRIATSVTLLASGVAPRSLDVLYDEYGLPVTFPNDTTFTLFPSYTREVTASESPTGSAGYLVSVRGWMWCPGLMLRKNRLVLSLAKQVTKGRSSRAAQSAVDRLNHDPNLLQDSSRDTLDDYNDIESIASSSSSVTSSAASELASVDQLIKERLSSFIARSIPKAHLQVVIGASDPSKACSLCEKSLFTDINGHFECDIFTHYEPSVIQVTCKNDETITTCQEVHIMPVAGFGVISDIDDTVKLTGVIGDKRELLNKILVGNIQTWNIPQVVAWYQDIFSTLDATFHYVSNSPWQLFSLISQYFESVKLPRGSVHLKQYSGNIITSLMEPSSSRKSIALRKILKDFPNKKFICIGDSGEQDMEAYTDLAKNYPDRIVAIFIRAVPDSFSNIDDAKVLAELKWMATDWEKRQSLKPSLSSKSQTPDMIDLSETQASSTSKERVKRLPPMVPRKPSSLKGNTVPKIPPLPERRYMISNEHAKSDSEIDKGASLAPKQIEAKEFVKSQTLPPHAKLASPPPPPPARRRKPPMEDSEYKTAQGLSDLGKKAGESLTLTYGVDDYFELEEVDARGAMWIQRVQEALHDLDGTNTKLTFFEDSDEDFFKTALKNL